MRQFALVVANLSGAHECLLRWAVTRTPVRALWPCATGETRHFTHEKTGPGQELGLPLPPLGKGLRRSPSGRGGRASMAFGGCWGAPHLNLLPGGEGGKTSRPHPSDAPEGRPCGKGWIPACAGMTGVGGFCRGLGGEKREESAPRREAERLGGLAQGFADGAVEEVDEDVVDGLGVLQGA